MDPRFGRTSLLKNPRLCSKHFEQHCLKQSFLMEVRLLGSSRMLNPLKTDATIPQEISSYTSFQCQKSREVKAHGGLSLPFYLYYSYECLRTGAFACFFFIFRLCLTYWMEIHRAQLLKTKFMKLYRRRKNTIHQRCRMRLHSRPSIFFLLSFYFKYG